MTWTCDRPECPNINPDDSQVCLSCGEKREDDRPAGLSEEERAAWDAYCLATESIAGWGADASREVNPNHKRFRTTFYRAARAPLEAKVRELEAWKEASMEQHLKWDAVCRLADKLPRALGREYQEIITEAIQAQLAQQKPAAPAGLPKVGEPVEVRFYSIGGYSPWHPASVLRHREQYVFDCMEPDGKVCTRTLGDEDVTWRRIPPRADEPGATVLPSSVENHLNVFAPAASPPGEMSTPTPNLDKVKTFEPYLDDTEEDGVAMQSSDDGAWLCWEDAEEAAKADIRAAVERETAKDKANINDLLSTCTRHSRERVQYKARIEALEKAFDETVKKRDAALAELSHAMGLKEEIVRLLTNSQAEIDRLRAERFSGATRANLEALCRYLNDTCSKEPEFYPGGDVAGIAMVLLSRARSEVAELKKCNDDQADALQSAVDGENAAKAEVERLKGELARAKEFQATVRDADRRLRFTCEANVPPPRRFYETVMAAMAKLEPAPAQPERKVQSQPQDEVFCGKCPEVVPASMACGLKECRIHGEILNSERTGAPKRCRQCLGCDPGAKGPTLPSLEGLCDGLPMCDWSKKP